MHMFCRIQTCGITAIPNPQCAVGLIGYLWSLQKRKRTTISMKNEAWMTLAGPWLCLCDAIGRTRLFAEVCTSLHRRLKEMNENYGCIGEKTFKNSLSGRMHFWEPQ